MREGEGLPKDYKLGKDARKMAQQLREFGDLPEDLGSIPDTHEVAKNHL